MVRGEAGLNSLFSSAVTPLEFGQGSIQDYAGRFAHAERVNLARHEAADSGDRFPDPV